MVNSDYLINSDTLSVLCDKLLCIPKSTQFVEASIKELNLYTSYVQEVSQSKKEHSVCQVS